MYSGNEANLILALTTPERASRSTDPAYWVIALSG
jgi:hypothetical protein